MPPPRTHSDTPDRAFFAKHPEALFYIGKEIVEFAGELDRLAREKRRRRMGGGRSPLAAYPLLRKLY